MIHDADLQIVNAASEWLQANTNSKKPTINDVAQVASVSKKTVSRVINHSDAVSEKTRRRVQRVIDILKFKPDQRARGLASNHAFLIGVIYDNPNPYYVVAMQQGILQGLKQSDYELVVHPCDRADPNFVDEAKQFVERQRLRGVILTPSISEDDRLASMLREIGCDYLRIASVKLDDAKCMMISNDRQGGLLAARHLCALGHTQLAFVAGKRGFLSSEERQAGFEAGLAENGLTLKSEHIARGEYTFESGIAAGHQLLSIQPRPTAIFAANDEMAAGVMRAMRLKKIEVPAEVSIVGYDDFQVASNVWPRLTTIHSPTTTIGKQAAQHLLAMDKSNSAAPESTPWLVERESSAPPPEKRPTT